MCRFPQCPEVAGMAYQSIRDVGEAFRNGTYMGATALPMLALMRAAHRQEPSSMDVCKLHGVSQE